MYIAIDGNEANSSQKVGSNVYAYQILRGLASQDEKTSYQVYLKTPPSSDLPPTQRHWRYRIFGPKPLWTQWRLPLDLYLSQPRPDIFFTPGHYAPRFSPVPTVITILDLAFLYFPDTFKRSVATQLNSWTRYSVNQAIHIFTISQNSKTDLINEYQLDPAKITVTYPGSNFETRSKPSFTLMHKIRSKYHLPPQYLIYVGTKQPRKNLNSLIQAVDLLNHKRNQPVHLIVTGKTWHQFNQNQMLESPYVLYTGFVSDPDLAALITGSQALVFPSLYEGFGIPVLEAMQLGVPVAASNVSSIPEITGASPFLFNPLDVKDIQCKLSHILSLKVPARKKIVQQGKIRARQFTWNNCVNKTKEILHELTFS